MDKTIFNLLGRAQAGDPEAWDELVAFCHACVVSFLNKLGVKEPDAQDLSQSVLLALSGALPSWDYKTPFQAWLKLTTRHRALEFWRNRAARAVAIGGDDFLARLEQMEDPASGPSAAWRRAELQAACHRALEAARNALSVRTVSAYEKTEFDGMPPADVALELGISQPAVYAAQGRVRRFLKTEGRKYLIDWS